jgi:hypothetical protein
MKRHALNWVFLVAATVGLSGCLDMEKLVHVKADGSGYVEERMLMKREALSMVQGMAKMGAEPGAETNFKLIDPEKLAAEAAAMGPGVTLISTEALSTPESEGYVARFAFTDINQLTLDQSPKDPAAESKPGVEDQTPASDEPTAETEAGDATSEKKPETIHFELSKGPEPVLIVHTPEDEADGKTGATDATGGAKEKVLPEGQERQMAMQMMQQMFKGMRVAVYVEVEGDIRETNAAYRDGSKVTLLDIRFDEILKDPERFERFAAAQPEGVEQVKALMKDLPGIKIEPSNTVQIQFAPK